MEEQKGYQMSNVSGSILPSDIYEATNLNLKDILAPAAIKVTPKDLFVGGKVLRTLFVISFPRFLSQDWFTPVINLDKVYDISIMVHPVETEKALRTFQKKVAEVQSQINERERKGFVRDPILDVAYEDLEDLRDKLQQAQERLFDVGIYITIYGNDKQEVDKAEGEVKSILDSKLVYVKPAIFQQEQGYRSVLPLCTDELIGAIKRNDEKYFTRIPGLGKKTALKIILELANKFDAEFTFKETFVSEEDKTVMDALSSLGFRTADIQKAFDEIPRDLGVEEKIREGIKLLTHNK
jgi:hypothetical protein